MLAAVGARDWLTREAVAAAARDYARGCAYAFRSDHKRSGDNWLHHEVIFSVCALGAAVVQPFAAVIGGHALVNLFAAPVALAVGVASGAWIVHRYRRRNYPDSDALATAVHVTLDKAHEVRARRRKTS
jgi:hypothetical protein